MIAGRSLLYNFIFYLTVLILMIVGLPMLIGGRRGTFVMARLWASASTWLLEKICNLRIEYRGVTNIPQGGYIIAAKHQSFLETFALLRNSRDFSIILKKQLLYIPLFGLYLLVSKQIAIDRANGRSALKQIVRQAGAVLRAGHPVFIYPEGTRRPPGAVPAYKHGVDLLYATTGAPCIPIALNTGLYWGRRGFLRRPGIAIIEYLPQIHPGMDRVTFSRILEDSLEAACSRLNEEAIAGNPSLASEMLKGQITNPPPTYSKGRKKS
jgi:1-acyl-sn-glycerol-3-phosphate acyltransferase